MALDDDHAAYVLANAHLDDAEIARDVAAACAATGLSCLRFLRHTIDLDIPIPLIVKVEACSHFSVLDPSGAQAARLYVDLWGEAYERSYGTRVRLVTADERLTLLESPAQTGPVGVARLEALVGRELPRPGLRAVLAASMVPALRDVEETMLGWAMPGG
jgi:hypothetical protein